MSSLTKEQVCHQRKIPPVGPLFGSVAARTIPIPFAPSSTERPPLLLPPISIAICSQPSWINRIYHNTSTIKISYYCFIHETSRSALMACCAMYQRGWLHYWQAHLSCKLLHYLLFRYNILLTWLWFDTHQVDKRLRLILYQTIVFCSFLSFSIYLEQQVNITLIPKWASWRQVSKYPMPLLLSVTKAIFFFSAAVAVIFKTHQLIRWVDSSHNKWW